MTTHTGTYALGPDSATLTVRTGKRGAAAMAGHNLQITVSSWSARFELAEDPAASKLSLTADSRSLKVIAGAGGAQALGGDDKLSIQQSIDDDVLKGGPISFESTMIHSAAAHGGAEEDLHVHGDLNLLGHTGPLEFTLQVDGAGHLTGGATVVQTKFGIKPFSILFGTLKVADEVEVSIDGMLPAPG
jgi:polyisoprenoid-binding protein YceI